MSAHAAIHVGLKKLGIEGDDVRDLYERQTGKRSLREMSPKEHEAVIGELRRLGFKQGSKGNRKRLEGRFAKKLQAQWIAAWNLGLVRDREDAALLAFVKRQTGIEHVRFLHYPEDARKAIDALKGWMARAGGVDWALGDYLTDWQRADGFKIAWAQFRLLVPGATFMGNGIDFHLQVEGILGRRLRTTLGELSAADWRIVMNALGERVRARKAKA